MKTTEHGAPRARTGRTPPDPKVQTTLAGIADANLAEESVDLNCIRALVSNAERSAQLVDDGMNETEASEERNAASEAQAMR